MRETRIGNWALALGVLGILSLTGCQHALSDAVEAGMFDFVTGTITDTLGRLVPVADMAASGGA